MLINGIMLNLRNSYIRRTAFLRRKKINKTEFTIISNNCWAGLVYESYGLPKQTPTVGMYFMADEYIKFVSDLRHYTSCEMSFIEPLKARHRDFYVQDKRFGTYPIAMVDDVEIALLHYRTEKEASEKWKRRCKRIQWDHLLVKMNDQNGCSRENMESFIKLPYSNKVFFTVRKDWKGCGKCIAYIPSRNIEQCGFYDEPFGASKKFNINQLVSKL